MAQKLTVEDIVTDLSLSVELDSRFAYALSADGNSVQAQQYADDGSIARTYTISIDIKEN